MEPSRFIVLNALTEVSKLLEAPDALVCNVRKVLGNAGLDSCTHKLSELAIDSLLIILVRYRQYLFEH